jgi:hypothetical protein
MRLQNTAALRHATLTRLNFHEDRPDHLSRRSSDSSLIIQGEAPWPAGGAVTHDTGFRPSSRPLSKSGFITSCVT